MRKFPMTLLLVAVMAGLLVLTLSNPTKLFSSSSDQRINVNFMSIAPALPNASGSIKPAPKTPAPAAVNVKGFPARPFTVDDAQTIVFEKAPAPVL